MKKLVLILFVLTFLVVGCKTVAVNIPEVDVVAIVQTPYGTCPGYIPKGHLNKENEKQTWMTVEEYKDLLRKQQERRDGV